MNRRIRQLALGLIACYVALFVMLNTWQIGRSEELNAQPDNTRQVLREFNRPRGPILSADGVLLARSQPTPTGSALAYQRDYPTGDLFANVVGYYSYGLGSTLVERAASSVLTGTTPEQQLLAVPGLIAGNDDNSGSVVLTVRADLQQKAREVLGEREGSIVVLDIRTGAILAMWSYPSFDPNIIADVDYDTALSAITELQNDPEDPLRANAFQQRYMPGSSFKIITTALGLESGTIGLASSWPAEQSFLPPQTDRPVGNYRGSVCGGDLTEVFARSCNTPFARTAIALGPDNFVAGTRAWGLEEPVPIDIPGAIPSTIGDIENFDENLPLLAMRGFGQNEVQMTPLHMAMVAAAVANDGVMMRPYLVEAELDHDGRVLRRTTPEPWLQPISPANAEILNALMQRVVIDGTARCCLTLESGIAVAAKTGTAQLNEAGQPEESHAWIVAFAPADEPRYAVAVMLKGTTAEISAGTGGTLAGPVAKEIFDELFRIELRQLADAQRADATRRSPEATDG